MTVQTQYEQPCIWALVDPEQTQTVEIRKFRIACTGHPIDNSDELNYIGTFQLSSGSLIFHLFEINK